MFVGVDLLGLAPALLKILANLIVIVLNYFAGKAVVFRESHADTGFHISSPDDSHPMICETRLDVRAVKR